MARCERRSSPALSLTQGPPIDGSDSDSLNPMYVGLHPYVQLIRTPPQYL